MKHELGLPFPSRNLRIKIGSNPSTIFLVIVVTDRHTERYKPTPVKTYSLAFAGLAMVTLYRSIERYVHYLALQQHENTPEAVVPHSIKFM